MDAKHKNLISSLYHEHYKKAISRPYDGFTIVELLIVIVIIGILAAIIVVSYTGISGQASSTSLKSDLAQAKIQLELARVQSPNSTYPTSPSGMNPPTTLRAGSNTTYQYTVDNAANPPTYCLTATNAIQTYHINSTIGTIEDGECPPPPVAIQTITSSNCPTSRAMVFDARDNHTYWVQKLADGRCWMLTNLAYAGGGANTYGDSKTLTNSTSTGSMTYTVASYYIGPNANPTTAPTQPSTSTDGGVTNPQYGYHYNWCAAMGVQVATSACASAATPTPNINISICPANWRLPTGEPATGELTTLNNAINGGQTNTDAGLLSAWFEQRAGSVNVTFDFQGGSSFIWSATQYSDIYAHILNFNIYGLNPSSFHYKLMGFSVRCIAI